MPYALRAVLRVVVLAVGVSLAPTASLYPYEVLWASGTVTGTQPSWAMPTDNTYRVRLLLWVQGATAGGPWLHLRTQPYTGGNFLAEYKNVETSFSHEGGWSTWAPTDTSACLLAFNNRTHLFANMTVIKRELDSDEDSVQVGGQAVSMNGYNQETVNFSCWAAGWEGYDSFDMTLGGNSFSVTYAVLVGSGTMGGVDVDFSELTGLLAETTGQLEISNMAPWGLSGISGGSRWWIGVILVGFFLFGMKMGDS